MTGASWDELRRDAQHRLARIPVASPEAEARWILEEVSGLDAAGLVAAGGAPPPRAARARLEQMLERREAGEPLQYVLGRWSFRGLDLFVDRRVLIPRPETELVVQVAIDEARRLGSRVGAPEPWGGSQATYAVADLGTGSGAIALALAAELPDSLVWATDVSEDALAVARANLAGAGSVATRVRLRAGTWYGALPGVLAGHLRLIVSNPPYVGEAEVADLPPEVARHEPRAALVSGPTGMEAIRLLLAGAPTWLEPAGAFVCELAPHQAPGATRLARAAGFADVEVRRDLTGRVRVLVARLVARPGGPAATMGP